MEKINEWLKQQQDMWQADFVGIARQVLDSNHCLVIKWCHVIGQTSLAYQKIKLQIGKGFAGEIWKTGRLQMTTGFQKNQAELYNYPIARIEHLDTIIGAPIFHQKQIIAVVIVGHRTLRQYSYDEQQSFITSLNNISEILVEVS